MSSRLSRLLIKLKLGCLILLIYIGIAADLPEASQARRNSICQVNIEIITITICRKPLFELGIFEVSCILDKVDRLLIN